MIEVGKAFREQVADVDELVRRAAWHARNGAFNVLAFEGGQWIGASYGVKVKPADEATARSFLREAIEGRDWRDRLSRELGYEPELVKPYD